MTDDPRRYRQIASTLRERIKDGDLKPGYPLPSIKAICQESGNSRQTCGKALALLVGEGLIKRIPGLGYFVVKDTA
jgi:DNA-binding GntR family transcriptional regulator